MDIGTGWYPVALADGLERRTSAGTRLFARELVVWRDDAGRSHVWEDRCPHRGMRLSFGFVRDNAIACLYHGWQYDTAARCRYIPAHPDIQVPGSIKVATYASVERLGVVWAYSEIDQDASELMAPVDRGPVTPVRSLTVDAPAARVFDELAEVHLPRFTAGAGNDQPRHHRAGALVLLAAGNDELIVAVQPLSDRETALHLVIAGAPKIYRGAGQKHFSAWAEAVRRKLETPEGARTVGEAYHEAVL